MRLFRPQPSPPAPCLHADIITLSSGERINPNPIEERVKRYIPLVRYVVLVGQDAPYLCALLTLKVPPGCVSEPRDDPGCGLGRGCCPGFRMGTLRLGEERQGVGPLGPWVGEAPGPFPEKGQLGLSWAHPALRKWGRGGQVSPSRACFLIGAGGGGDAALPGWRGERQATGVSPRVGSWARGLGCGRGGS